MWKMVKLIIISVFVSMVSACASSDLNLNFSASQRINTSSQQAQLPLAVKIYQLSSSARFQQADFQALWLHDKRALRETLLDKRLLIIKPGEKRKVSLSQVSGARFIGIVAISQHHPGTQWQLLQAIPKSRLLIPGNLNIYIDQGRLMLQ